MWHCLHRAGSPQNAYRIATSIQPWLGFLCFITLAYGIIGALLLAPADYQQGDVFRLMYLHVPAAIGSIVIYGGMSMAALFYLIWKIKVANMIAEASASIGAVFTLLCLVTGALWGKPTWGTFWIWDARLTSELLLLFIYLGIIALRKALPEQTLAAKSTSIFILVGLVNIPIIHYSVVWWNTLHQGSSLSLTQVSIASDMLYPLLAMLLGFMSFYAWFIAIRLRQLLLTRESETQWVREIIRQGA